MYDVSAQGVDQHMINVHSSSSSMLLYVQRDRKTIRVGGPGRPAPLLVATDLSTVYETVRSVLTYQPFIGSSSLSWRVSRSLDHPVFADVSAVHWIIQSFYWRISRSLDHPVFPDVVEND